MKRIILISTLLLVTACSPMRLQQASIDSVDKQGRTIYRLNGYGDPEEMAPKSSTRHIEHALSDACPSGVVILTQDEIPTGSMISNFLYWSATARCK